jgi:predicted porin
MKKSLMAFAGVAVLSAGPALAQSSVTLFGVADVTLKIGHGSAANVTALGSGGNSTSRIGFRGTEDLGGGMAAGFWLEAGQQMDNGSFTATNTNNQATGAAGSGGMTFNRRSTVSLSAGFGEFRLGRDLAVTYRNVGDFDPWGDVGVGGTILDSAMSFSTITRGVRVSNSINYFLPANLGGFYGQGQYYMGENAADTVVGGVVTVGKKDGTGGGARLGYAQGPINVALAFGTTKYVSVSPTTGDLTTVNLGGSYDFGVAKLIGLYNTDEVKAATRTQKGTGYLLGVSAPMGAGELRASYSSYKRKEGLATGDKQANKLALGYVHNLSKRTALYTTAAFVRNKNGSGIALNSATLTSANDNSSGLDIGLRHSF